MRVCFPLSWQSGRRARSLLKSPTVRQIVVCRNVSWSASRRNESAKMAASTKTSKRTHTSSLANCHLQVLGTGGGELKPCLFLFTDTKRYLFNCVENIQRFSNEHRVRYSKLRHLFVTRLTWYNIGGLCGLAHHTATFHDAQSMGSFHLHGPDSLADLIKCTRFQLSRDKVQLEAGDPLETVGGIPLPVYRDENLTVHTLALPDATERAPVGPLSSDSDPETDDLSAQKLSPELKKPRLVPAASSTAAFLCKLADVPGKFNPRKAGELGLPPGPQYKDLVQGKTVIAPNGQVIQPSDVLGPTRIGPSFVVLECPHKGYVPSITSHPLLQREAFDSSGQNLMLVVHMAPRQVLESEQYCQWAASLGPHTRHMLLHETVCPKDWFLRGFLKTHGPLHLMSPSVFRMLSPPAPNSPLEELKLFRFVPPERVILGRTLLNFHFKPSQKVGVDESQIFQPFTTYQSELMGKIKSSRDIRKALKKVSVEVPQTSPWRNGDSPSLPLTTPGGSNLLITFLGTGASCPSKYRNVSAILLQTASSGNVLFDCGEGTLAQIYRHFGSEEGDRVIAGLGKVFISHMHGDHNLGLISVLNRRAEILRGGMTGTGSTEPTVVLGPKILLFWLSEYRKKCEKIHYKFVESYKYISRAGALGEDQLLTFQTVPVDHCKQAYGVVAAHSSDWKVVYSGDTRPCPELARVGKNATLLLHEATLDDDMLAEAKEKKHCTISEALSIAEQMNPDFTILTHFSQRYCKIIPPILSKTGLESRVFIAFDHMTVMLSEVHRLPALLPGVQDIFSNTLDEEEMLYATMSLGW